MENKDYSKYKFNGDDKLEVDAAVIDIFRKFAEEVLATPNVGVMKVTTPRFEFVDKDGVPAKPKTSKAKLEKDYKKIFSLDKTLNAQHEELLTDLGRKSLSVMNFINSVHKDNVDAGKATLIEPPKPENA